MTPDLWPRAASFAATAHEGQFRRDGRTPYAAHPSRVAMTVAAVFGCIDDEALAIAWLHDVIEDTTTDYEDLLDGFNRTIADGVAALSKNAALPSERREAVYDEGLENADWRAKLVKLADVFDNMADATWDEQPPSAGKRERLIARAVRAIGIARRDRSGNASLARAAEVVEQALERFRAVG
ncbi:MAG: bifunctional (p)ppGpp synthetase/guanosine-3',5'-bis(diphosphate) 3'-pyrophosphohydrolase [Phycisphaeraceae bacterium]|nr:MAG: bifunctional (p)ppGpp synthetase/guanosine-3',5'-bis(diphosphate) 3'-pyrophosphohydrolase [Phycisphaeraceae bacterium]